MSILLTKYKDQVLKKESYPFGTFYFLDKIIVSEINEGVNFTWTEAKQVIDQVTSYYDSNGHDIVYISNRINSYSVSPTCWLNFFKEDFTLLGYGIVSNTERGFISEQLERLFFKSKIRKFTQLEESIEWAFNKSKELVLKK